jgi:hypothetical protein
MIARVVALLQPELSWLRFFANAPGNIGEMKESRCVPVSGPMPISSERVLRCFGLSKRGRGEPSTKARQ